MPPTVRTTPSGMLVVVAVAVWPGWIGRLGFQDSVTNCPESWVESDVIAWSPVLEDCNVRVRAVYAVAKGLGADPAAACPGGSWLRCCVQVLVVGIDDGGQSGCRACCYSEVV